MLYRIVIILLVLLGPHESAMAAPRIVADLSERRVDIAYHFAGTNLLLFGACIGLPANARPDVVVVVRGPARPLIVRHKSREFGLWINSSSTAFRTAPTYYALASSAPLERITSQRWRDIYELGLESLHFSPVSSAAQSSLEISSFRDGFVGLREELGLFSHDTAGVEIMESSLFRSRIKLPPRVPVGDYKIEIYIFNDRKLMARHTMPLTISKSGVERRIFNLAHHRPLLYGFTAVLIALLSGWSAAAIAQRLKQH
jgi:uncharacterized protein (TIGR02186 family)